VKNPVDIGGVADVAEFQFELEVLLDAFYFQGESWTIREVINNGFNPGQVDGTIKYFHTACPYPALCSRKIIKNVAKPVPIYEYLQKTARDITLD
jgi:hypothetical protein